MMAESWMLYVVYVQPSPVHGRGRGYAGGFVGVVEYVVVGRGEAVVRDEKNRVAIRNLIPANFGTVKRDITAAKVAVKNWTEV